MKIAEDLINDKKREIVSVPTTTTLSEAVSVMQRENVGCLLVTRNDTIAGIWTERDLARNVAADGFGIASAPIERYMHSPLITCEWNDTVYSLVDKILGLRVRHLIVQKEDRFIGLISAGDVMKATLHEKDRELGQANATMSWEYYEEWKRK